MLIDLPDENEERASRLNLQYQRELAAWKALPRWKQLMVKKPRLPEGYTPAVVLLPDIPAEYLYIHDLRCKRCNERVQGQRLGPSFGGDSRMHDRWVISCSRCHASRSLILSVPRLDGSAFFDVLLNERKGE